MFTLEYPAAVAFASVFGLAATRMTGSGLRWLAPLGGVGYIIFLIHPSVFAIAERLCFHPSALDIPAPLYIGIMLTVVTLFAFFVKKNLSDPIQAYGGSLVSRLGRRRSSNLAGPAQPGT